MSDGKSFAERENRPGSELYTVLHEGIPDFLRSSIVTWIDALVPESDHTTGSDLLRHAWLNMVERNARVTLPGGNTFHRVEALEKLVYKDEEATLRVLDVLVPMSPNRGRWLRAVLREAGSEWTVWDADYPVRLTRVVSKDLQDIAESLVGGGRVSGAALAYAWRDAYGQAPDGQAAFNWAIKAIEAALWPIVEPKNEKATLGTMLPEMRKADRFSVLFIGQDALVDFAASLSLLWRSQYRHGTGEAATDGSRIANTLEQGRAAVLLATVVVQWLVDGVLTPRA